MKAVMNVHNFYSPTTNSTNSTTVDGQSCNEKNCRPVVDSSSVGDAKMLGFG
jgi:hypothetical protein